MANQEPPRRPPTFNMLDLDRKPLKRDGALNRTLGYEETPAPTLRASEHPVEPPPPPDLGELLDSKAPGPNAAAQPSYINQLPASLLVGDASALPDEPQPRAAKDLSLAATMIAPSAARTIASDPAALFATIAVDSSHDAMTSAPTVGADSLSCGMSMVASGPVSAVRTTVLPRVKLEGAVPQLVREDRTRYEPVKVLGAGGVGEVLQAQDNDIGRLVAVKRLLPDMQHTPVVVRFMQEIRTIGRLEHPNIIPIHDVGIDERGEYYFVMKYMDGETLESIIEKLAAGDPVYHRRFPFERRMELFEGVLEALHYAHAKGIVHRDIKPANIMVGPYGEVMVMDWGLARQVRSEEPEVLPEQAAEGSRDLRRATGLYKTQAGSVLGTPMYMAPEQARGEPCDERSDIYSLTVMLQELLSLKHYLSDKQSIEEVLVGVVNEKVPLAGWVKSEHQGPVPMDLTWFVNKGVKKDPAQRYQSIVEMIVRLQERRQGRIPIECHITAAKRVSTEWVRLLDRFPLPVTLAMMAAIALAIGMTWHFVK